MSADLHDPTAAEVYATAQRYVALGLSVIPVRLDGSKMPDAKVLPQELDEADGKYHGTWKPFQERQPTEEELREWFGHSIRRGIAIPCGEGSNKLEVIDCDEPPLWPEWCELVESHDPDLFAKLAVIETPSGGKHAPYRCEKIEGNQKLAQRGVEVPEGTRGARKQGDKWIKVEVLFETRGQGGYIVAPGSPLSVHSTGRPYRFIKGSAETIPTLTPDERDLLINLARNLNEYQPPEEERRERQEYKQVERLASGGLRPGDDFNERGDALDALLNHDWTISHRRGSAIYLRKPGKRGRGHQATLHAVAHNVFYCFSTSAAPFEDLRGYSAFQVYALLEHNGDFTAAASDLAAQGYGDQIKIGPVIGRELPSPPAVDLKQSTQERIAKKKALTTSVAESNGASLYSVALNISEVADMMNFICSRAKCPADVKEFAFAVVGAWQEKHKPGAEWEWFDANDYDIGKRMLGQEETPAEKTHNIREGAAIEGMSIGKYTAVYERRASERIKKKAQRGRAKCDAWQKLTGYVFIESENGGAKEGQKFSTRYKVPLLLYAAEGMIEAQTSKMFSRNPRKAIQQESRHTLAKLETNFIKRERFRRPRTDAASVFARNNKLIMTKYRKNLELAAEIPDTDPTEYVEKLIGDMLREAASIGFEIDRPPLVHLEKEKRVDKPRGEGKTGEPAHLPEDIELWDRVSRRSAGKILVDKSVPPSISSNSQKQQLLNPENHENGHDKSVSLNLAGSSNKDFAKISSAKTVDAVRESMDDFSV